MKYKCLLIAFLTTLFVAANAQTNVQKISLAEKTTNNITYSLPKTLISVEVVAEKTISKPGPFYQYAERYLAIKDGIMTQKENWEIVDINIKPIIKPDSERTYQILASKKGVANNITLTKDGIIMGVNIRMPKKETPKEPICIYNDDVDTAISFNLNLLSAEALQASSISKMAEIAAKQIYSLREARNTILTLDSENLPDGKATKVILDQIAKEEEQLISLFIGKSVKVKQSFTYIIEPTQDEKNTFARFSTLLGCVDADDVIGTPLYINIEGDYKKAPEMTKKEAKKEKKATKGFYYNIPGSAKLSISYKNETIKTANLIVPQFGYTLWLDPTLTDGENSRLIYDPNSGVIVNIRR